MDEMQEIPFLFQTRFSPFRNEQLVFISFPTLLYSFNRVDRAGLVRSDQRISTSR